MENVNKSEILGNDISPALRRIFFGVVEENQPRIILVRPKPKTEPVLVKQKGKKNIQKLIREDDLRGLK